MLCPHQVQGNALYYCVRYRHEHEIVKLLLDHGADFTDTGERGETCLMAASRYNLLATCRLLVERGSDVYETDDQGRYAMHACAISFYDTTSVISYLLNEAGKADDVNLRDFHERTPLHAAVAVQNTPVVRTLLAHGADVSAKNDTGKTPLQLADQRTDVWSLLVEHCAKNDVKGPPQQFEASG